MDGIRAQRFLQTLHLRARLRHPPFGDGDEPPHHPAGGVAFLGLFFFYPFIARDGSPRFCIIRHLAGEFLFRQRMQSPNGCQFPSSRRYPLALFPRWQGIIVRPHTIFSRFIALRLICV